MTKIKNIVLALLFVFGVSSIASANDIYITQSGDTLDLDITQDGQNNVIGTSTTDIELTGDSMTLTITQTGNSNVAAIDINGNTYTGTLSFTGNSCLFPKLEELNKLTTFSVYSCVNVFKVQIRTL